MARQVIVVGNGAGEVRTLADAHRALEGLQPRSDAPAKAWEAWYREASRVYAAVAELDKNHHHEALSYWSNRTRQIADEIARTGERPGFRFSFG
ncbi:AMED_5909 family protein [Actinokineospora sp. NPDC004072]